MIDGFKHKGLEKLFYTGSKKGVNPNQAQKLTDILDRLDAAIKVQDMNYPGSDLHPLKGDCVGYWAVKVTGNWRVMFQFDNGNVSAVDYVDYH
ncbi:MAG: type II toxin-antitoxin system RelE/ParE family toxin [Elusimicrobiota bacterium]